MSKQEALYEFKQGFVYMGKKLRIRFSEEYFDSVPRPVAEERRMLKEDIQENGLIDSIKLNNQGIVLDGHTRMEICEELGWKKLDESPIIPKFEVKEFNTKAEERIYVIKTNLMRRHLNTYQKVKLAFSLYDKQPNGQHTLRAQNRYDILVELKKLDKPVRAKVIGDKINMSRQNVLKLLEGLVEDFCVRQEEEKNPKDTWKAYLFSILPKAEEVLAKGKPERVTIQSMAKSIGVGRDVASKALFLMEHAKEYTKKSLEDGTLDVNKTYLVVMNEDIKTPRVTSRHYIKGNTKVICPHCENISRKDQWKLAKDD